MKKNNIKEILKIECLILLPLLIIAGIVVYNDYSLRPGVLEVHALEFSRKDTSSVDLSWKPVRNADQYIVSYKEKGADNWQTIKVDNDKTEVQISDLKEGQEYQFSLKANSKEREGHSISEVTTATKKTQKIEGKDTQMKLAGSEIDLKLSSATEVDVKSENEDVAVVEDSSIKAVSPGTVTLTATAEETDDYVKDEMEIEVEVLDSVSEDPASAPLHTIRIIDKKDCELLRTVTGTDKAKVPQSFDYDGRYIIAYGMDNTQRIVVYDKENKDVYTPNISLGHANGFAFANGKGYSVKGRSLECVSCDLDNNDYCAFDLKYGASGIAYDKANKKFYTSSVTALAVYSEDFQLENVITPVRHKGKYYTQDCGGHSGIMMHCVSDENKHGINYIDLYDMVNGKYLGTINCDLSEVESAAVDDEGYMILLCNTTDNEDYIWKTPINIADLGAELCVK